MSFLDQSQSKIKQNQCDPGLLSALNWKLLHQNVNGSLSNLKIYYLIFICFPGSGRGKISKYWENQNDQEHLYGGCRTQTRMWGKKDKEQGPTYYNSTPQLVKKDFCCVRINPPPRLYSILMTTPTPPPPDWQSIFYNSLFTLYEQRLIPPSLSSPLRKPCDPLKLSKLPPSRQARP